MPASPRRAAPRRRTVPIWDRAREFIGDHCRALSPQSDLVGVCQPVLQALADLADAPRASILIGNPLTGRMRLVAAIGLTDAHLGADLAPQARSISDHVLRTGHGVALQGAVQDDRFAGSANRAVRSSLCVPLMDADGPIGVLSLARSDAAAPFVDTDAAPLQAALAPLCTLLRSTLRHEASDRSFESLIEAARPDGHSLMTEGLVEFPRFEFAAAHRVGGSPGGAMCERVTHADGSTSAIVADLSVGGAIGARTAGFVQGVFVAGAQPERSCAGLVAQIGSLLHARAAGARTAALWVAHFGRTGDVTCCAAGLGALWIPAEGATIAPLAGVGPEAGGDHAHAFEEESLRLLPGDTLLVVNRGVLDVSDGSGRPFGTDRLVETAESLRHQPADELTRGVCDAVLHHTGRWNPVRDLLALAVRYHPGD